MAMKDQEGNGTRKFGYIFAWLFDDLDPEGKPPEGQSLGFGAETAASALLASSKTMILILALNISSKH